MACADTARLAEEAEVGDMVYSERDLMQTVQVRRKKISYFLSC